MSTNASFGWVPTVQGISNVDLVQIVHCMFTVLCGHMVLYDMCCLGGCEGSCVWSSVCMEGHLRGVYGGCPKWCVAALAKCVWSLTLFEAPYSVQTIDSFCLWDLSYTGSSVCAYHCTPGCTLLKLYCIYLSDLP